MLTDYMSVGTAVIANAPQLRAFLRNGEGAPLEFPGGVCGCDTLTPEMLGDDPWTTPDDPANPAEWYDPAVPESADFLGLYLLNVQGTQTSPRRRAVTPLVGGGGSFGSQHVLPRVLTVTAILVGRSCCAVDYGYRWLMAALQGCSGQSCGGDCVEVFDCCPEAGETPEAWQSRARRTYRRVALTSGPDVVARDGAGGCSATDGCTGADVLTVEFDLTAATPDAFGDAVDLLSVAPPVDTATCVAWCVHSASQQCDDCRFAGCPTVADPAEDPAYRIPEPPPAIAPDSAYCDALSTVQACYEVDLSLRPQWIDDVPMIQVYSGNAVIRNLTISVYERTQADLGIPCDELAATKRCTPAARWEVQYMPPGSTLILDGQVDRAMITARGVCTPSNTVYGDGGSPVTFPDLTCSSYCICIETNSIIPPASDAQVTVAVSGRYL